MQISVAPVRAQLNGKRGRVTSIINVPRKAGKGRLRRRNTKVS